MTDHLAILDSAAPHLSLERAARSYHEERIPLSPPLPDRDMRWRWGVAILAAVLLHIGVVTTIDDGFQRDKSRDQGPVPVEIVTEPASPPPPPKPVEKPEEKPPQPQQPEPARSSGGEEEDKSPGEAAPAPKEEASTPPPVEPPPAPIPEEPAPAAAPALPAELSPQAEPVPPASSPQETQQALVSPPVPLRKPPTPPSRHTTTTTTTAPATPQKPAQSDATAPTMDLVTWEQTGGGDKYLNAMRDKIKRMFYYPPTAEMFRWTGTAVYELSVNRQGEIIDIQLTQSSHYDVLDKAGFTAIKRSSPFDPLPANVSPSSQTIGLTLILPMPPPE